MKLIGDNGFFCFGFFWSSLVFFFFFLTEMLGLKCFEVAGYCIEIRLLSFLATNFTFVTKDPSFIKIFRDEIHISSLNHTFSDEL